MEITLVATDADNDPLTDFIVDGPSHDEMQFSAGELPTLTYVPDLRWSGVDRFTFKANDGLVDSNIATVSITVIAKLIKKPSWLSSGGKKASIYKDKGCLPPRRQPFIDYLCGER